AGLVEEFRIDWTWDPRWTMERITPECRDRCLRIVHGKGYNSEGGHSVLKEMVRRWLKQRSEVMAFVQAPPHDGDAGAVIVLLDQKRRFTP
ncbi:MAG: Smr/MutS family protein, partial [Sutterella wadsworthensis]|nr:Smr/MutS family protein [Sutterella wadsworthensis]